MAVEILVYLDVEVKDQKELFDYASKKLLEENYVTEDYPSGLQKREQEYPTGLKTQVIATAIPHTEMDYVRQPFIAVVRPTQPIEFTHMAKEDTVWAEVIFFLGICEANHQLLTIQQVLRMISDQEAMQKIMSTNDPAQIKSLIRAE